MLVILCVTIAACQQTIMNEKTSADWYCDAFQPILWSREDSTQTQVQIIEHNAVWDSLCRN